MAVRFLLILLTTLINRRTQLPTNRWMGSGCGSAISSMAGHHWCRPLTSSAVWHAQRTCPVRPTPTTLFTYSSASLRRPREYTVTRMRARGVLRCDDACDVHVLRMTDSGAQWPHIHKAILERCNPWPHVTNRHISGKLLLLWHRCHYDVIRAARAYSLPTKPAILVMTSLSLWRHSLLSWPRPALRTYVGTYARTHYRV